MKLTARTFFRLLWIAAMPLMSLGAQSTVASATPFVPGGQELALLDFSTFPLGRVVPPRDRGCLTAIPVCDIKGALEIVMQNGKPMLRASAPSSFVVRLRQRLPPDFTLEFDLIGKGCCRQEDLAFEGTFAIEQSDVSANVQWHYDSHAIVGGVARGGFNAPMPAHLSAAVKGSLANIAVSVRGPSLTMYTNNEEIYSVQRAFVRSQWLRVFLGGQNNTNEAVYLGRFRIGSGAAAVATQPAALPASANPLPNVGRSGGSSTGTMTQAQQGGAQPAAGPPSTPGSGGAAPGIVGATGPGTTVNPGVTPGTASSTSAPAATNFNITGQPLQARLSWMPVVGATRYVLRRAFAGTTTWTTVLDQGAPLNQAVDALPDHRRTYTYQLVAYQASGNFGTVSADYAPPAPADPTGFYARVMGPGEVEFGWVNVVPDVNFFLNGPGAGNGVSVAGMNPDPTARITYTLRGIPAGTHTWTLASSYQPGGVLTPASAWRTTTATVTADDPTQRYRLTALGVKALQPTADNIFAIDGMGDEIYVAAMINTTTRSLSVTNVSTARSATYGDIGTANAFTGRNRAGTYGATGGIKAGDQIPISLSLSNPSGTPNVLGFPLMLWEGVLDDNAMVVVEPTVWEEDLNNEAYARWLDPQNYAATAARLGGPIIALRDQGHVGPVVAGSGINIFNDDGKDRPIGLSTSYGAGAIPGSSVPSLNIPRRYLVLTKVAVEGLLNGPPQRPGSAPGVILVLLNDNGSGLTASYELYLRVERVSSPGGTTQPPASSPPASSTGSTVTAIPVASPTATAVQPGPTVTLPPNAAVPATSSAVLRHTGCENRSTGGHAPQSVSTTVNTPVGATVTWPKVPGAFNYVVDRTPTGTTSWVLIGSTCGGPSPIMELAQTMEIHDRTGSVPVISGQSKSYTYRVTALGPNGETGWNTKTWIGSCMMSPKPLVTVTGSTVTISWSASLSSCSVSKSNVPPDYWSVSLGSLSKDVTSSSADFLGVTPGTYQARVVARWRPDGQSVGGQPTTVTVRD